MISLGVYETVSTPLRNEIKYLASQMWCLNTQTALHPLHDMAAFNKILKNFSEIRNEADLCCSVMDHPPSSESEDRASHAASNLIAQLTRLENNADTLIKNEGPEAAKQVVSAIIRNTGGL